VMDVDEQVALLDEDLAPAAYVPRGGGEVEPLEGGGVAQAVEGMDAAALVVVRPQGIAGRAQNEGGGATAAPLAREAPVWPITPAGATDRSPREERRLRP
jgi:hypothetical protein